MKTDLWQQFGASIDMLDNALLASRPFTKEELRAYLEHGRMKCRLTIEALTDAKARQRCKFPWVEITFLGLLVDSMRHVQEHTAQLNMVLGQKTGWEPGWFAKPKRMNA